RKTVSVTPAMGARTVAGVIWTPPMERLVGTGFTGAASRTKPALSLSKGVSAPHELSQNFFTVSFYLALQNETPALREGLIHDNRLSGSGYFLAGAAAAAAA